MLIAQADGIITADERAFINRLVDTSILKEKSKNEIITKINSQLNISDIQRDFTEKEKKSLLIIGLKSCMADGKIAKSELNTIFDLARYLSINKTDVNQLIKKYRI